VLQVLEVRRDPGPDRETRLRFGPFELDPAAGELRRAGLRVRLQPQPLRVLVCLVRHSGRVVDRETLRREIWGDTHVDFDRGLNFAVLRIRAALGDDAEAPRYVQTLPRRGYRFIAPVERETAAGPARHPSRPSRRSWPVLAGIAAALLAGWTAVTPGRGAAAGERALLAVIPFESLAGAAPELADGLTEELITRLGRLDRDGLGVIGRSSVWRYRQAVPPLDQIRRSLGVDYVVEGSVRQEAGRARVAVRLLAARDGSQLWSESFEGEPADALALQAEVARRVSDGLARRLLSEPAAPPPPAVRPGAARDAYHTAVALLRRGGREDLRRAAGFLERALEIDPGAAVAWAALADVRHRLRMAGVTPGLEAARAARDAAERARALDPDLPEAHHALALVELWHDWNPAAAGASLRRVLRLAPSSARAHHDDAWHWVALGRPEAALAAIRRARRYDPISPRANCDVGWVLLRARRYGEAIAACRRALDIEPGYPQAESCLASAALRLGHPERAVPRLLESLRESGVEAARLSRLESLPAERAVEQVREWRLARLREQAERGEPDHYHIAVEEAALGRAEQALVSLERGFAARLPSMVVTDTDPEFDPLRDDPRFRDLVRRVAATRPLADRN
jgi:TolB-like protein/DNA-binding winged helix-turn-helix (wHTH) protein/Tfp pilus assembly protein PilF